MNYKKITALVVAFLISFTVLASCTFNQRKPENAVDISQVESELIESMRAEGKSDIEIAEALTSLESEYSAASLSAEESDKEAGASGNDSFVPSDSSSESDKASGSTQESSSSQTSENMPVPSVTTSPEVPSSSSASGVTPTATPKPVPNTGAAAPTDATTAPPASNPAPTSAPAATSTPKATSTPVATSTPTLTPTPSPVPTPSFNSSKEYEVLSMMNNLRKERAVADHYTYYVPLEFSSDLVEAAHTRCEELISDFSHSSPSGIGGWCENIYWASYDAAASRVYNTWYNSSGHYNNMIYGCEASGVYCLYCGIGIMLYDGELFAVYLVNGSCPGTPPASGYVEPVAPPPEETTSSDSGTPDETTEGGT